MSKQEFCLQSLNGRRAMPTDIKYSFDSILRVLACTPACQTCTCKLQGDVSLVSHSLPFVTLDSGGDRDASSAKTVVRSTWISIRSLNARQRARRQRIGADSAASYVDLGKRASRYTHTHTHRIESGGRQPPPRLVQETHPTARRLVRCRLRHHSCCRC